MAWYEKILSGGIDSIVGSIGNVLDNLFTTDDEKQKNKIAMMQVSLLAARMEKEIAAEIEKAYLEDSKNMRKQLVVELQSKDSFVRRARPTFNYIFYVVLIFNYIFIPIYQLITGNKIDVIILPTELWTVFGVGFIGYGYLRTVEKTGVKVPRIEGAVESIVKGAKG